MKKLTNQIVVLYLVLFLLINCSPKSKVEEELLNERIQRIENGLQPDLQIQGDTIPVYNLEERLKELGIPGLSIAVLNNGEVEWARGYGMADSTESREVTTETLFLAGSISKPVAATRTLQLVEEDRFELDTNVNNYLVSWKVPDNEFTQNEKVTTRRILNHTAGLTVWGFPGYDKGDTIPSVVDVLDGKGNTDSVRVYKEPGESWMYSGGGYTIMQLMITDIEGRKFPEIMQDAVLNPLGMNSSTFENPLPDQYHSLAATGYRTDGNEVEGKWPIYPEMAAAGLWTTPSELILWAKEIQKIHQLKEDGILSKETVDEMLTPGMNDHGLGPGVSEHTFGHGGADEGFRANLIAWKDKPVAVVIMVNSDNGSIIQEVLLSMSKEYQLPGIEPKKRTVKKLPLQDLEKFIGEYNFPEFGNIEIIVKDNGLEAVADFTEEPFILLPESNDTFFDKQNGEYFTFLKDSDSISGIKVQNYEAKKIR
ncbi:serine hydrolase [Lutimonas zeaxanthinifaciens]|uniref:serine hydrolase n=1 Tax=Lutimonas zeaxanthinifaciens TaxID=3060215 RepID=UPI00265D5A72|nr:serine hydrolase [Lutimonas sp. YSD2104]WKK66513.1 serine hydrolase [Lutimonas sp. YSD2104]